MTRVERLARRLQTRWRAVIDPWWLAPGALEEFRLAPLIVAAAAAGLVSDGLIRLLRPSPARVGAYHLLAALVPLVVWSAYFVTVALVWGTWWTVNLVGGAVLMSSLAGAGLAALMAPWCGSWVRTARECGQSQAAL
jgi:hypothetical protein